MFDMRLDYWLNTKKGSGARGPYSHFTGGCSIVVCTTAMLPIIGNPEGARVHARTLVHTLMYHADYFSGLSALQRDGWQNAPHTNNVFIHPAHPRITVSYRYNWTLTSSFRWKPTFQASRKLGTSLFGYLGLEFVSPLTLVLPLMPTMAAPSDTSGNERCVRQVPPPGDDAHIWHVGGIRVEFRACSYTLGASSGFYAEACLHRAMVKRYGPPTPRRVRYPTDHRFARMRHASSPEVISKIILDMLLWVGTNGLRVDNATRLDLPSVAELVALPLSEDIGFLAR